MNNFCLRLLSSNECLLVAQRTLQLSKASELNVLTSQLEPGSEELIGYRGEYYKLRLTVKTVNDWQKTLELEYFVKCLPLNNTRYRAECEDKGFFRKESGIYREILHKLQNYATKQLFSKSYYTRDDLMVLEDLTKTYRHLSSSENHTLHHYKLVLENLAQLHSASIAWERAEEFNIGQRFKHFLFELHCTTSNDWYMTGIKGILFLAGRCTKYQNPTAQNFITKRLFSLLIKAANICESSWSSCNVFCHRDIWDRNILYKFEDQAHLPTSCSFVDFQLSTYGSPALDVLFMLYLIPKAHVRRDIYNECLDYYFDCLQENFTRLNIEKSVLTKETFLEHCKRARIVALVLKALCEPFTKIPKVLSKKFEAEESEKYEYYINSDRTELFLRIIEMEASYEQQIMLPVEELVDYLMKNEQLI